MKLSKSILAAASANASMSPSEASLSDIKM